MALAAQRVIYVGDRHQASGFGDVVALQVIGITLAVVALVMTADNGHGHSQERQRAPVLAG